jgi:integrase
MAERKLELRRQTWGMRYDDLASGKTKWKTFGHLPKMTEEAAELARHKFLADLSEQVLPVPGCALVHFVERIYFPEIDKENRGSTVRGYRGIWASLPATLKLMQVSSIRTPHLQVSLKGLAEKISYASLQRVRSFMKQVFSSAIRLGYFEGENPARETQNPRKKTAVVTYAYSLQEIRDILDVLPLLARAVCAVAAFAGLRAGEIFGLQWGDWNEEAGTLNVKRAVGTDKKGRMIVQEPKTETSKGEVPVIPPLAAVLKELKASVTNAPDSWMFPASFVRGGEHTTELKDSLGQTPLSPANFVRDRLGKTLALAGVKWEGLHSFRRGLATNLHGLGIQDIDIQAILRHSDVAVTRAAYIKGLPATSKGTMERLNRAWDDMPTRITH